MLLLNVILGFMVVTHAADLSRLQNQAATTADLRAVRDRLSHLEQSALVEIPAIVQVADDVKRLKGEVFGAGSTFISSGLSDRIDAVERTLERLQSCVNRLGSDLVSGNRFPVRC